MREAPGSSNLSYMRAFCIFFLLIASFSLKSQKIHEVKADVLLPFFGGVHFSYEYIPNGILGIEFEARYRWAVDGAYRIAPPNATNPLVFYDVTFVEADQQVLTLTLAGKYYFIEKRKGIGLFVGGYLRSDVLLTPKIDLYDELTLPEYNYKPQTTRHLRNGLGVMAGYNYVFKEHLLIEIGMGFDINLDMMFHSGEGGVDIAGIPTMKAGYRF